jgi:hypothetical protein
MTNNDFHVLQGKLLSNEMILRALVAWLASKEPDGNKFVDWLLTSQLDAISDLRRSADELTLPTFDQWEANARSFVEGVRDRMDFWEQHSIQPH